MGSVVIRQVAEGLSIGRVRQGGRRSGLERWRGCLQERVRFPNAVRSELSVFPSELCRRSQPASFPLPSARIADSAKGASGPRKG